MEWMSCYELEGDFADGGRSQVVVLPFEQVGWILPDAVVLPVVHSIHFYAPERMGCHLDCLLNGGVHIGFEYHDGWLCLMFQTVARAHTVA